VARPIVADTTVFVAAIRGQRPEIFEAVRTGQVWLPVVVLAELYVGARMGAETLALNRLAEHAARGGRLLVPVTRDWIDAGRLIARRGRLQGALRPRDHLMDVLIVLLAARIGGEVLTANVQHFQAWAHLARRGDLDVTVRAA
jgi:predicted nucleic acid-binding protein